MGLNKPWICRKLIPNLSRIRTIFFLSVISLFCVELSVSEGSTKNSTRTEPLRVFKYVSEDQILQNSTGISTKVKSSKIDPVLKSARSVTDRSLIPNSFFGSQAQNQNHQHPLLKRSKDDVLLGTHFSDNSHQIHYPNSTNASFRTREIHRNNVTYNNDLEMSERSRRSPYRNVQQQQRHLMYNQQRPIVNVQKQFQRQRQKVLRRKKKNPQQIMIRQVNPNFNNLNRAALYMRNQNQFQNQLKTQNFPSLIASIPQNYPQSFNMQKQKQVRNNVNRGVAVVMPPKQGINKGLDTTLPSPSSDFAQYQQYPQMNSLEEPTWNHPMYQRYSKAAKNVQNKVSGYISGRPMKRDGFRDFSKIPPIPLPRPNKKKGSRGRPWNSPPPPPPRYSYPKSSKSIQDILNHFNQNEINDEMGPSKGSRYGPGPPYKKKPRERNPIQGPGAISDLSSELNDVQFSLLRDIREFAKRPMTLGRDDDDEPPDNKPIIPLKSPETLRKPYRMDRDDHDEEMEYKRKYKDRDRDPHSPLYNHEAGFDEIFNPGPKPVRAMIKKSSRFRQEGYRDERENSREKDYYSSRKKDRPPPREDEEYNSPYYYSKKRDKERERDRHRSRYGTYEEDSTERSAKDVEDVPHNVQSHDVSVPPFTRSVEIEIEERKDGNKRGHHRDHHNHESSSDRERESYEMRPRPPHKHRERERDYPKSIRDKIRDAQYSSVEYSPQSVSPSPSPQDRYKSPSPIVIKRPYEYEMPPEVLKKKMQNQEFWNNYANAGEKNIFGGYSNPSNLNVRPSLPQMPPYNMMPPLPPPQQTPTVLNPYFMNGRPNNQNQFQLPGGGTIIATSGVNNNHESDLFEIHTGRPNNNNGQQYGQENMQKAYLELLQQKMQHDANLMPKMSSSTTKKTPTPMRMKIHIYPNDQQANLDPTAINPNENINNQYPIINSGNAGYYSGSSHYSSNTVPLLSPRYPQKVGGGYNNNFRLPGPAPSIINNKIGTPGSDNKGVSNNNDKTNKNLVLHLHVHRRNDVGPVELVDAAQSSNHFISTDKPINYKEIYQENGQDDDEEPHLPTNSQTTGAEADKSVSMEVPIHDDRIEDVLHTLLQFRDRGPPTQGPNAQSRRKRRKRRK